MKHTFVRPPIIVQLSFPGPKNPTRLLLIRADLCCKPFLVKVFIRVWIPVVVLFDFVRRTQTPFTNDIRGITVQVVLAGGLDILFLGDLDIFRELEVAMVVIGSIVGIFQVFGRVTRPPVLIHHLDVQILGSVDIEVLLNATDSLHKQLVE